MMLTIKSLFTESLEEPSVQLKITFRDNQGKRAGERERSEIPFKSYKITSSASTRLRLASRLCRLLRGENFNKFKFFCALRPGRCSEKGRSAIMKARSELFSRAKKIKNTSRGNDLGGEKAKKGVRPNGFSGLSATSSLLFLACRAEQNALMRGAIMINLHLT